MDNIPTGYENMIDDLYSEWFYCNYCEDESKGTHCLNCE